MVALRSGARVGLTLLAIASLACVGQERPLTPGTGGAASTGAGADTGPSGGGSTGTGGSAGAATGGGSATGGFGGLFGPQGGFGGAGGTAGTGTSGLGGRGGLQGGTTGGGLAGGYATCPPNTETPIAGPLIADFSTASSGGLPALTPPYRAVLIGNVQGEVKNGTWHIVGKAAANDFSTELGASIDFGCIDTSQYTGISFTIDTSASFCPGVMMHIFDWYGGSVFFDGLNAPEAKMTVKLPLDWGGQKATSKFTWLTSGDTAGCTFDWVIDDVTFYKDSGRGGSGGATGASGAGGRGGTGAMAGFSGAGGVGGTGGTGGRSDPGPVAFVSGSRLRAHVWDAGRGARKFYYWQDQGLGAPCFFKQMPDGVYRCIPWDAARQVVFLDPGCTQPVINYQTGESAPRWGRDVKLLACGVDVLDSMYVPAEPISSTPAFIYTRQNTSGCSPSPGYPGIYARATPADLSTFVSATAAHDVAVGGVSAETLTATDGTQQTIAGWDLVRDAECAPAGALFGQLFIADPGSLINDHCVPREAAIAFGGAFSDAACSNQLAGAVCPPGAVPKIILDSGVSSQTERACSVAVEAVGAAVDRNSIYWSGGSDCSATTPDPNYYFATLGAAVAANAYPSLRRVETGTGRIRVRSPAAASGPGIAVQQTFYDSTLGVDCVLTLAQNLLICFPADAQTLSYNVGLFADAACTDKLFAWDHPCGHPDPTYVLKDFNTPVRAVPYPGTSVYANGYKNITGCVPFTPPSGTTLFTAGSPVPAETFGSIVETTE